MESRVQLHQLLQIVKGATKVWPVASRWHESIWLTLQESLGLTWLATSPLFYDIGPCEISAGSAEDLSSASALQHTTASGGHFVEPSLDAWLQADDEEVDAPLAHQWEGLSQPWLAATPMPLLSFDEAAIVSPRTPLNTPEDRISGAGKFPPQGVSENTLGATVIARSLFPHVHEW